MATAPATTEWIEWTGGECPVSDSALVMAHCRGETREEAEDEDASPASDWDWDHKDRDGDVIAYRVVG